jgi:hypothetical protein
MRRRIVHQWRDWLLEQVGEDTYELSHKDNLALHSIVAKDAMDAENQAQQIIRDFKNEVV